MKKKGKYTKAMAEEFFNLCKQGKTLTIIASELGVLKEYLHKWSKDPRKPEFQNAWLRGQEAFQAYHEDLLDRMLNRDRPDYIKCNSDDKTAQIYRLKVLFKHDWSEKSEPTQIEVTHKEMSKEEVEQQLTRMFKRIKKAGSSIEAIIESAEAQKSKTIN